VISEMRDSFRNGKAWIAVFALAGAALAGVARAEGPAQGPAQASAVARNPIVLELFTSQGCSSCPPADALLSEIGTGPDVVALAFHVDYWNDLGWADPFSQEAWTARQRNYGRAFGGGRVYTPQLVVEGKTDVVGSNRAAAERAIADARKRPSRGAVEITIAKAAAPAPAGSVSLVARWELVDAPARNLQVLLAVTESGLRTPVVRGENGGQTLASDFVVRRLENIGTVKAGPARVGSATTTVTPDRGWKSGAVRFAVLVQDPETLEIVAASVRSAE
jgi:hypothetical protein